jgi:hypothetical protein
MASAAERRQRSAGYPIRSERGTNAPSLVCGAGPQPIADFLPRLQTHVRWIPVRVWRDGTWQAAWIVIRSLELVHVSSNRPPRARRFDWRDHA